MFLISYLHQTTTKQVCGYHRDKLFLISYLHQTTTGWSGRTRANRCFLSRIYIKPQQHWYTSVSGCVVSYLVSTSNHNYSWHGWQRQKLFLISYLHQTTTDSTFLTFIIRLFLISYLHQTTTVRFRNGGIVLLFLISYLHQTTTTFLQSWESLSCFLSRIYIKPQHAVLSFRWLLVVSYLVSTSNHNNRGNYHCWKSLFLISYLHQTTTLRVFPNLGIWLFLISYLHQTTTNTPIISRIIKLFLISYLHQTTTNWWKYFCHSSCFLSRIYIKPQPHDDETLTNNCCFLSRIYIKPQPHNYNDKGRSVVSYLVSTSNHNRRMARRVWTNVVSYLVSTSNHNGCARPSATSRVVSYLVSTSNHNRNPSILLAPMLFLISYLHQTTTACASEDVFPGCFLSRIYIKPQLGRLYSYRSMSCFLSRIYIKPQPVVSVIAAGQSCFLSRIYIKPQLPSRDVLLIDVVSYLVSTSNHNRWISWSRDRRVVSYLVSTSNHNL